MKYTIQEISNILKSPIIDGTDKVEQIITNFEYQTIHINNTETAFFSISSDSWKKFLKRESKLKDGNKQLNKKIKNIGLIITEEYIDDLVFKIPQIVVEDSIEALKVLAVTIRKEFKNPIVTITGSMGKSSTRLMLAETLKGYKVLENRANSNTRIAVLLQMCKLASNPDFAIFEVSLNALNNRGNFSLILKPDIAIITGIGPAHLSTLKSEEDIAHFKSRIFYGLNENGVAIINKDTLHSAVLINHAKKVTNNILTYSLESNTGSLKIMGYSINKGYSVMTLKNNGKEIHYKLSSISKGMIENSLAVVLCLINLKVDINNCLNNLSRFKPFKRVLEIKEVLTCNYTVTLIDDTHNASLPAMINAIEAFNSQSKYYSGNKIIAIGKISDLGAHSKDIHKKLIDYIEKSNADIVLCLDDETRVIVNKVKNKNITWFNDPDLLLKDLLYLTNEDSLILLKSSVTDTQFPKLAQKLPDQLENFTNQFENKDYPTDKIFNSKSYIKVSNETNEIIEEFNVENSSTISGLAPILYYIHGKNINLENKTIKLKNWPTNDSEFYTSKELTVSELLNEMSKSPHPSLIYQLSNLLFINDKERKKTIEDMLIKYKLSQSSIVNVTGRYRKKERQSFTVLDLYKLYNDNKDILLSNKNKFIFGDKYNHGIINHGDYTTIFTSCDDISKV
ncbi:Mur ligase family protein [Mammaliicoccus fleurettii]|uniref:Mur ligase family protein n=1 Tax=Mammaliicoccus fleurettii TaxID=150056 RepID=UPI000993CFC0|nr:Mur ligase family protein [Mammaliicoccus fleurettii]OOV76455.1 hypothetical protein B2G86_09515 [Mammaliicoccus fleurettii]